MGNAFRVPGERPTVPVCESCGTEANAAALQFGPDGRQLCRTCFGHLQAAQADRRAGMSPGTGFFGRMMRRNPALFIRLAITAIVASFMLLLVAIAGAGAAGEALRDCADAHRSP
jgi:hypothetical protein